VNGKLIAGSMALAVLFVGTNVARTALRAAAHPAFWLELRTQPIAANAIRLVALGDSSVEAIGADQPMDGYVGRIAAYVEGSSGRPVHIANVSDGGTTRDIVHRQLPKVNLAIADIVIVADSNDLEGRVPLDEYRIDLTDLMSRLPANRTVFSDLPIMPGREPYQAVLADVTDAHGIRRADFAAVFGRGAGRRLDIFSWLPPHLNSTGYELWFGAFQPKVDEIMSDSQSPISPDCDLCPARSVGLTR